MIGTVECTPSSRRPWPRLRDRLVAMAVVCFAATAAAQEPVANGEAVDRPLTFMRVHVPRGAIADVPLGNERYVPMSLREFEQAIARPEAGRTAPGATATALPLVADAARYEATINADGAIAGTLEFEISGGFPGEMPLGTLGVTRAEAVTAAGTGEVVVFGRGDGSFAIPVMQSGTYRCVWNAAASGGMADTFSLPLVSAVRSTVTLRLPAGVKPLVSGARASPAPVDPASVDPRDRPNAWRIEVGPARSIDVMLAAADRDPPGLAVWTDLLIRGRQALLSAKVEPATAWTEDVLELEKDEGLDVVRVFVPKGEAATARELVWSESADRTFVSITLPAAAAGTMQSVVVEAVAPFAGVATPTDPAVSLPLVRAPRPRWAGGGMVLRLDPDLSLTKIEFDECLAVTPEAASRWPLAALRADDAVVAAGVRQPTVNVEQQGQRAEVRAAVAPRNPEWDVARVTTIDIAPAVVLGRAACDIRVLRGEAFDVKGRVAPGWIIDSVEAVEWPQPGDRIAPPRRRAAPSAGEPVEWKVVRDGSQATLRIGLTVAATPASGLGLLITGHRAGVPLDASFSGADIDMVSLEGESADQSIIAFKTNPDATVEPVSGRFLDEPLAPRLAALAEDGATRGWTAAGAQLPAWEARLVRRRPPLDAKVQVRLTARDDRLTESFTFECRPDTSELDALVVQFSEPMDGLLEWSLLPPATGTVTARRIESAPSGRRDAANTNAVAESWLVEIAPPVSEPLTVRAIRTVPFAAPLPVPLAWVEGAVRQVGQVVVRDGGRTRPQVLNRRLGELAPLGVAMERQRGDDSEQLPDTIGEFSFPSSPTAIGSQEMVAEILPGGAGDDARAWAWSEETRSWCHTSGQTEYETIYDIENHGRSSVTLSLPAGRRLQGILIDGVRLASDDRLDEGTVTIDLPAGRRRLQAIVRSVADAAPGIGAWRIDPSPGVLDLPVLERTWRVLVPPPLEVAVPEACRGAGIESPDWIERLLGARLRKPRVSSAGDDGRAGESPAAANASTSIVEGFRERVLVPAANGQAGLLVVRTSLLRGLAIVAGLGVAVFSLGLARIRGWLPLVLCVITALTAVWIVSPYEMIARAAWWGAVAAWWLDARWLRTARASVPAATALMACLAVPAARAESPANGPALEPLRVYITPVDGGETALVPEPLFRILVRNGGDPAAAARVMSVDVQASVAADENIPAAAWRLAIDVDADAGAMLVLGQGAAGGRWVAASALINGRPLAVRPEVGDRRVRLRLPDAGRHRIEIDVEPAVTRAGELEYTRIDIPVAPSGTLVVRESTGGRMAAAPVVCERGPQDGPFAVAPRLAADGDGRTRHDVSRAAAVQLVRSIDGRTAIAGLVRSAESRNDVFWDLDACRVNAVYEIDSGDEILSSVVVAADPRLAIVEPVEPGITIRPLGGNRFLVTRSLPERGAVRIEIPFRMPLVDPVGSFDLPQAWLEGVAVDRRTTRLLPSPSLAVQVSLPAAAVTLPPREKDPALQTHAWFTEHVHAATVVEGGPTLAAAPSLPVTGRLHRARVTTERRRQALPGTQNLSVRLFEAQTRLDLEARIDASSAALVVVPIDVPRGSVIDRLSLFEESLQPLDPVDRGAIDVRWTRTADDRVVVVMQQPRAGRFRLELAAHLPVAPAREGKLPLVRAVLDDSVPMAVSWNSAAGSTILDRSAELFADERPPVYVLDEQPAGDAAFNPALAQGHPADGAGAAEADAAILAASESKGPRVELADIEFNVEERGRAWGLARFEMLGQDPLVRLRLPPGMRLFDAFVDGHALVPGVPSLSGQANEWELRLHDVRWPRSLVVVFAGELGGRLAEGAPVELPAPSIVGLPCTRVVWTLNAPRGLALRVAEPAIVVDAAMVAAERKAAIGRLEADFDRAIAASPGAEQERLREFFGSRWKETAADGLLPKAVAAVANARGATAATHVIMNPAVGELTIRGVRPSDPSVPGRAITTLATLALGGAALRLARRGPLDWARAGRWFFPGIAATLGVAWLLTLSPSWPGGLLVGYAIAAMARELLWPSPDRGAVERVANDDDTVTQLVVNPAATRESSITQIAPSRGQ